MSSVFWQHVRALTLKECRQIARDKSSIILGVILPFVLIVLFGQGIRFDVKDVCLAVADLERSEASANIAGTLAAKRPFSSTGCKAVGKRWRFSNALRRKPS